MPVDEGWFVLNARDAEWLAVDGSGAWTPFQGGHVRFGQVGIALNVLGRGEGMAMYHAEEAQEDFLVLKGEGLLIVEGEERPLKT